MKYREAVKQGKDAKVIEVEGKFDEVRHFVIDKPWKQPTQQRAPRVDTPEGYTVMSTSYYHELLECQKQLREIQDAEQKQRREMGWALDKQNAELGALVRKMKDGWQLSRNGGWMCQVFDKVYSGGSPGTPEEAITHALEHHSI